MVIDRLSGLSKTGFTALLAKTTGNDKLIGYMYTVSKGFHSALMSGAGLKGITDRVAYDLNGSIRKLHGKESRIQYVLNKRHLRPAKPIQGPQGRSQILVRPRQWWPTRHSECKL